MDNESKWTGRHSFSVAVIIAALIPIGLYVPSRNRLISWILVFILLLVFCLIAGHGVTGLWRGLLIDERKKISLSRLQMSVWTLIILSGFMAAAFSNLSMRTNDPLAIAIPEQLWILLGIGTTSLVASPLIRSTKTRKAPSQDVIDAYSVKTGIPQDKVLRIGTILYNRKYQEARWSDLFEGEGIDSAPLDLAKVQMFFFTLILAIVYIVNLGMLFLSEGFVIDAFPPLSSSMIALLAISNGGYLVDKAVPRS